MARRKTSRRSSSLARKRPGRTPKVGEKVTIKAPGKKPLTFTKGKLHRLLGVPQGEKIPQSKVRAALAGKYGPEAKKAAVFAFKGPLKKGRQTAARHRKKK